MGKVRTFSKVKIGWPVAFSPPLPPSVWNRVHREEYKLVLRRPREYAALREEFLNAIRIGPALVSAPAGTTLRLPRTRSHT